MAGETLGFYPSERYLAKNWAPEEVSRSDVEALARASRLAADSGILSSNLSKQMLANSMVEGHGGNYGIPDSRYGYPATPRRDMAMEKMGFRMANSDAPKIIKKWADVTRDTVDEYQLQATGNDAHAKLAAVILAEKANLYGEDKAIERWNGKGRAKEEYYGELIQADAPNHARKVREAEAMLRHPKNASVLGAFMDAYARGAK